jgi:hypothetical protein
LLTNVKQGNSKIRTKNIYQLVFKSGSAQIPTLNQLPDKQKKLCSKLLKKPFAENRKKYLRTPYGQFWVAKNARQLVANSQNFAKFFC